MIPSRVNGPGSGLRKLPVCPGGDLLGILGMLTSFALDNCIILRYPNSVRFI